MEFHWQKKKKIILHFIHKQKKHLSVLLQSNVIDFGNKGYKIVNKDIVLFRQNTSEAICFLLYFHSPGFFFLTEVSVTTCVVGNRHWAAIEFLLLIRISFMILLRFGNQEWQNSERFRWIFMKIRFLMIWLFWRGLDSCYFLNLHLDINLDFN